MIEIQLRGRGGEGVQVGCQILADAFFRAGAWVQAFVSHGGERGGGPVTASLRVDDRPVLPHDELERPHCLLVFDSTLLGDVSTEVADGGIVAVNAPVAPCRRMPRGARVVAVDGTGIAKRAGLGPIVATAVIGGFCGATRLVSLDDLAAAVEQGSPAKKAENVKACTEAYREASSLVGLQTGDRNGHA